MGCPSLYPPSPVGVPDDLTERSPRYRTQILLVLLSLGLFFLLYFGIMAVCALFILWAVGSFLFTALGPRELRGAVAVLTIIQLVVAVPVLLLFIYMVKNLFRFGGREKTDHVELFEDEHPRLFDFIYRACDETGAPYPKRVFVNFEVNAMAFSDGNSFWHLFIPSRKNLLIGLGLVNVVNLTEFKALLAHEFGHFSQKSMRLGAYVYTAFGIINQIVEGRDFFDRFIDGWCRLDPRIAWLGYITWAVLWILRRILMGLRFAIFYFHQGLSRQMEFNADLVAVSVTGSDAPVHLLYRCIFADRCLTQSLADIQTAMDHRLYTADLFQHQTHAAAYIRRRERKPTLGEPPVLPSDPSRTTTVFQADDREQATMWASHPANPERERNAKELYIRTEFDERSPWLLFDNVPQLRADVTYKLYRVHFKTKKDMVQSDAAHIQAFIDAERAETTYHPRYQGLYDNRDLVLGDIHELARQAHRSPWPIAQLSQTHATLYNVEVKHRGQLYNKRLEEYGRLLPIAKGWHRPKNNDVEFRGEVYDAQDAKRLLRTVEKELKQEKRWLAEVDQRVFLTYFQMALQEGQAVAEELFKRYRFHLEIQQIWLDLREQEAPFSSAINFLDNLKTNRLDREDFHAALTIFRETHQTLRDVLRVSEDLIIPDLKNMAAGQPLRKFLLEKRLVERMSKRETTLDFEWISRLIGQLREVSQKVHRLHSKSLGGILALQERIEQACQQRWEALPAITELS